MNFIHLLQRAPNAPSKPSSKAPSATSQAPQRRLPKHAGFTLVELLVVMAIIILISGFIVTAISGGDGSQALNSGISKANGIFSVARSAAVQRKTPMRVLVHFDPTDPDRDKFLRYMITLYLDDSESPPQWKVYSEGEYLPNGVYFSPGLANRNAPLQLNTWQLTIDQNYNVQFPHQNDPFSRSVYSMASNMDPLGHAGGGGNEWYVYEFNPNGTFNTPGMRFVLAYGVLNPEAPELRIPNMEIIGGFALFRSGKAVHFQSPSQLMEN